MFNKTPIEWFSKRQNTVEMALYGSEFVAACIAVDQIVDLHYTLQMLGVPLTGLSWMYHRVCEAKASGFVNFVHFDGKQNPADILTKPTSSREWYDVMKPLIFWLASDGELGSHRSEGSSNGSSRVTEL
jgi:hypothetical protein